MMEFYQLFRFIKRFYKEKEKALIQQSMRIKKLGKVRLCFITCCLIMIINFFSIGLFVHKIFISFASSFAAQFFISMTQEISKRKTGNDKLLGMVNYNIYLKNSSNILVINLTQTTFLYSQNVHDT